jgi:hypothetical protein
MTSRGFQSYPNKHLELVLKTINAIYIYIYKNIANLEQPNGALKSIESKESHLYGKL